MFIRHDEKGEIQEVVTIHGPDFAAWARSHPDLFYLETDEGISPGVISMGYVVDGAVRARPTIDVPAAVDLDVGGSIDIRGLPSPCTVTVGGETFDVPGGEVTLSGDMADSYDVVVEAWPHFPATIRVTVS